jgi:hypothetical protein
MALSICDTGETTGALLLCARTAAAASKSAKSTASAFKKFRALQ